MTDNGQQTPDLDPLEMAKTMAVAVSENMTLGDMAQALDGYARLRIKGVAQTAKERAEETRWWWRLERAVGMRDIKELLDLFGLEANDDDSL